MRLKRHLDDEVARKRKELEEIQKENQEEINGTVVRGEQEREEAERIRVRAESERQQAERKRIDDDVLRRSKLESYKIELEDSIMKRQQEADRYSKQPVLYAVVYGEVCV